MRTIYLKTCFILFTLIIINSCALLRPGVKADITKTKYTELLKNHAQWQASVKSMQAETRITLDTPQFSGNFFADIFLEKPDSLLVSVRGAFGIHLGKVFVAHNRFVFYNQINNQFFTGNKSDFEGRNFLQFPVEISRLGDVFVAHDNFDVLRMESYTVRDNAYYLEADDGSFTYHIWFDPGNKLIQKIEYFKAGDLIFRKEYKNWREENGILFPHLINFVKPQSTEGLSLFFSKISLNQSILHKAFEIKIPADAEQTNLSL